MERHHPIPSEEKIPVDIKVAPLIMISESVLLVEGGMTSLERRLESGSS